MKTTIEVVIDHKKPLPGRLPITDVIADRLYMYLYANACEAGVDAKVLGDEVTEQRFVVQFVDKCIRCDAEETAHDAQR